MTRVAAVDCGTNSVRLLVADVRGRNLDDVVRRMEITRLGQGVDRTGQFDPVALGRTIDVLREYADQVQQLGASRVRVVATSATRDAENRLAFVEAVEQLFGVDPEVVTGDEEARLSFAGATHELDEPAPYLVVDIGGGSTEFVLGDRDVVAARSVDIGCVRLTERHLHDDPPTLEQVEKARADVGAALDEVARTVPINEAATLVGLAGSVTTVTAISLDLPDYDPERIHHARVSASDVHKIAERLLASPHAVRAQLPAMHPGRVDVIAAGALVLDEILQRTGLPEVLASEHDILDGIALSLD